MLPNAKLSGAALGALVLMLAGCRQDMHDQAKYTPLRPSDFYADNRSSRPIPAGTVARGHLNEDVALFQGRNAEGRPTETFPFPITKEVVMRGQDRYNVFCTPCHDRTGSGQGMVVLRGFKAPPSYHTDRLRLAAVGHFYDVITNGFGSMQDYAAQIAPRDRWAIVAYIRALQLSQNATPADAPAGQLGGAR